MHNEFTLLKLLKMEEGEGGVRKKDEYEHEVEDEDRKRNQNLKNYINKQMHFGYFAFMKILRGVSRQKGGVSSKIVKLIAKLNPGQ